MGDNTAIGEHALASARHVNFIASTAREANAEHANPQPINDEPQFKQPCDFKFSSSAFCNFVIDLVNIRGFTCHRAELGKSLFSAARRI